MQLANYRCSANSSMNFVASILRAHHLCVYVKPVMRSELKKRKQKKQKKQSIYQKPADSTGACSCDEPENPVIELPADTRRLREGLPDAMLPSVLFGSAPKQVLFAGSDLLQSS
jgi:hypothetical protein